MNTPTACDHDYEHVRNPRRAVWVCPKCDHDISLEYLFWYEAVHPDVAFVHKPLELGEKR